MDALFRASSAARWRGCCTQVGALVPKVSAQFMKGDRVLDFFKIKRHTVVVFGSYT